MRLVFAGTPDVAVPALQALVASRHEVAAVITRPAAAVGRGRTLQPSAVETVAAGLGLEVLTPPSTRDPAFQARLGEIEPDCCPVVAYGGLIPAALLDLPSFGWVNLHFSVLPAWRGAAPVQRALMAGDEITGATTFRLVEELDAGPTYGVFTETIRPDDTAGDLLARLADHGAGLLVATLDGIEAGALDARPQPSDGVSYAPKLAGDDGRVRWTEPAFAVDRRIRGCTPAPGAWTEFGGGRLQLGPVGLRAERDSLQPGAVEVTKSAVFVGTGSHAVELGDVQAQGKARMRAADWARGLRTPLTQLGS